MIPSKDQWKKWSLPSKASYIGLIIGIIGLLIWLIPFTFNGISRIVANHKQNQPIFTSTDTTFNVLILPFNELCSNGNFDIGYEIYNRIEALKEENDLWINAKYLDITVSKYFNSDSAYSYLMKNKADMIIYGKYLSKNCNVSDSDEYCINYIVDSLSIGLGPIQDNISQKKFVSSSFQNMIKGEHQGKLDFIIFTTSAYEKYWRKNYSGALIDYKKIENELLPENFPILLNIGICYKAVNNMQKAKEYATKVLKIYPSSYQAIYLRAQVYLFTYNLDSFYFDYSRLRLLKLPELTNELNLLAGNYYMIKYNYDSAYVYYSRLPNSVINRHPFLQINKAKLLFYKEEFDSCLILLNSIKTLDSVSRTRLFVLKSMILYTKKDYLSSLKEIDKAIKYSPYNYYPMYLKGVIYNAIGDFKSAIQSFESSIKIDSLNCDIYAALLIAYLGNKNKSNFNELIQFSSKIGCKKKLEDAINYGVTIDCTKF